MFIPRIYKNEDLKDIKNFVLQNGFGILVTQAEGNILATHIPMELEAESEEWILKGHIAKANPQWKQFSNSKEVLAIFQGAHAYISSSWYNHINVPTWNYLAVHLTGKIRIVEENELLDALNSLVEKYEKNSKKPFETASMSPEDLKKQMRGIVGFEIKINKIEGKKKLSQNRNLEDFQNVIEELEKKDDSQAHEIAKEMKNLKK